MSEESITITLGPGARSSKSETKGFFGGACKTALAAFSRLLGTVESSKNTAEFYQEEACQRQEQLAGK